MVFLLRGCAACTSGERPSADAAVTGALAAAAAGSVATTQNPWRPELLADLAPYHVLRFMDWNEANDQDTPQAGWSTRKKPAEPQDQPVAYEWQLDLCNRVHADYWLAVPTAARLRRAAR